ncbi:MAG: glycosyltransferase [Bryobacterales bacterium]|nr:glycosyltransferase [Bryobacterales bacterium]MBV9398621.1 glycosyltransferase [Bryobacterales bacterium]
MTAAHVLLGMAAIPFIYYLIAVYSSWRYFHQPAKAAEGAFTPPVSNLKPIRGLDPDAYENLASFCMQDYPDYEIVFCIDSDDPAVASVIDGLKAEFPERRIRVLHGSGRIATNDKVAKLARLVEEAEHEVVVISDSDVRVRPDYLRRITAPLRDPGVGAVTCFYTPISINSFTDHLQTAGMTSDFFAGVLVAWQLDGIKFALGTTIATTRSRLAAFGGYASIENQPADDLLVGRLIAEQGREVVLLPYVVETVPDYHSMRALLHKRLRWLVVMRHMRPSGHFGLLFTQGLPWSLAAVALHPTVAVAVGFLSTYYSLRVAMAWVIGIHGLKQPRFWKQMPFIPIWDATAFVIWVASFLRKSIRWRGADYYIREGKLVPVAAATGKQ